MSTETLTVHTVVSASGETLRAFPTEARAAAHAEHIGALTGTRTFAIGESVPVRFATHRKVGRVVRIEGGRLVVALATRAGGPVSEKRFAATAVAETD